MEELKKLVKKEYVENDKTLCFATTPVYKIWVLSLLSGGLYEIILIFNYWRQLKNNFGWKLSPIWRTIFLTLTNFRLFYLIGKYTKAFNVRLYVPILLAFVYFSIERISFGITKITWDMDVVPIEYEILDCILPVFSTGIMAYIQSRINKVNRQNFPEAPVNGWKVSNTIWTVILSLIALVYILLYIIPTYFLGK